MFLLPYEPEIDAASASSGPTVVPESEMRLAPGFVSGGVPPRPVRVCYGKGSPAASTRKMA
jgi:hypothetical protein